MFGSVRDVDWTDFEEAFPAFVTIATMPFTFNIGYGIVGGVITWLMLQILLAPVRYRQGISPFVKARVMWADAWVEPSSAIDEQAEARDVPRVSSVPEGVASEGP